MHNHNPTKKMKKRLILATCFALLLALPGCDRPEEDKSTIGSHTLVIVDTSGKKPLGGTSGGHRDDVAGTTTHTFESANGRYKIQLLDEVLTINGEEFTLSKPGSEIRIVDDRIEINGVEATPDKGS